MTEHNQRETAARPGGDAATPTPLSERIAALDVLRGFAILGILAVNFRSFAFPLFRWDDAAGPDGRVEVLDLVLAKFGTVWFDEPVMALFALLFGAGFGLASERARGNDAVRHVRRMVGLLVIGHLHAFGLWHGDILIAYATAGFLVYPASRLPNRILWPVALGLCIAAPIVRSLPPLFDGVLEPSVALQFSELAASEAAAQAGGYASLFAWRAAVIPLWQYFGFWQYTFWLASGLLLVGVALRRHGLLDGTAPVFDTLGLAVVGYGLGLALTVWARYPEALGELDTAFSLTPAAAALRDGLPRGIALAPEWRPYVGYVGSGALALGHLGLVLSVVHFRAWPRLCARLAAIGRMSLSHYLAQSGVAALLCSGWGFGLWNRLEHTEVAAIVVAIWVVQLAVGPALERRFERGPAERLSRWFTYGRF